MPQLMNQTDLQSDLNIVSLRNLIHTQGDKLFSRLTKHRKESFPPAATKSFRKFGPAETAILLGVTESYLRKIAAALDNVVPEGQTKRTYSLGDIQALRQELAAKSRTPEKYLPNRTGNEQLQIIAVVNFKGGSAKTTTAANLAQYLALHGYRTLAIDLDPQASLTTMFGIPPETDVGSGQSIYGAIRYDGEPRPLAEIVRKTYIPGLDLVPAALELMEYEHETPRALMAGALPFDKIAEAIAPIEQQYDVAIIDCPPQLGYLTMSALVAATSILITVHPEMLDVMSMSQFLIMLSDLLDVIATAVDIERPYDWLRYLLTRFEPSDGPQTQMAAFLRSVFGGYVLTHPTLKSTAISDAGLTSQTIYEVERQQFTRGTYDRAIETVNSVNAEIEQAIRAAWRRT
jgi:chromosome partitioning protein